MKQNLYVLVGIPGSGKSTYAKRFLENSDTIILSSDLLRQELLGDINNQSQQQLIFAELYKRMNNLLKDNKNVVIDATNANVRDRSHIFENLKVSNINKIAIVMDTPFETCCKLDLKRERTVGEEIINKFFNKFEEPTIAEGFDEIRHIHFKEI